MQTSQKIEDFHLILLAGGRSSRMGRPKGLLDYHGHPWLMEQLLRFKDASGKKMVVVLGFHRDPYFARMPWMEKAVNHIVRQRGLEISVVVNPTPEQGQFSSLHWAIQFMQKRFREFADLRTPNSEPHSFEHPDIGAFVLPIDVPCPKKEVFEKLVGAFSFSMDAAIPRYQSRGGHPVLLGRAFLDHLAEVPPASSLARLDLQIQGLPVQRTVFVPVGDKSICLNMNVLEEFRSYLQKEEETGNT